MKVYNGRREGKNNYVGETLVVVEKDGDVRELTPEYSLKVRNISPTGFNWGYIGAGPAQLALTILLDTTGLEITALSQYHDFMNDFVFGWKDVWTMKEEEILDWSVKKLAKSLGC